MSRNVGFVVFIGLIFILGFNVGSSMGKAPETKNVATPQVSSREPDFIKLKNVDDRGFILAGSSLQSCSNILNAFSEGDAVTIRREASNIDMYVDRTAILIKEREALLKKLGY